MMQRRCVPCIGMHDVHVVEQYDSNVNHLSQEASLFINQKEK